jgi:hypothetical protein
MLAHSFRGLNPWSIGLFVFGPVVRQHICHLFHIQEAEREREEAELPVFPSGSCPNDWKTSH